MPKPSTNTWGGTIGNDDLSTLTSTQHCSATAFIIRVVEPKSLSGARSAMGLMCRMGRCCGPRASGVTAASVDTCWNASPPMGARPFKDGTHPTAVANPDASNNLLTPFPLDWHLISYKTCCGNSVAIAQTGPPESQALSPSGIWD